MKLLVYGDLHTEFAPFDPPDVDADVILLAGDIGVQLHGLAFAARLRERAPVVYVAGNHEYYKRAIPRLTEKLRGRLRDAHVCFLQKESTEDDGVRLRDCAVQSMAKSIFNSVADARRNRADYSYANGRPEIWPNAMISVIPAV